MVLKKFLQIRWQHIGIPAISVLIFSVCTRDESFRMSDAKGRRYLLAAGMDCRKVIKWIGPPDFVDWAKAKGHADAIYRQRKVDFVLHFSEGRLTGFRKQAARTDWPISTMKHSESLCKKLAAPTDDNSTRGGLEC